MKFEAKPRTASFQFTTKDMLDRMKELEWLQYEVDPEWKRFCSFGPKDIGGPFEKLGIIRKRVFPQQIVLSAETVRAIESENAKAGAPYFGPLGSIYGLPIIESDLIGSDKAYMISNHSDFIMPFAFDRNRHVKFGDT